MAGLADRIKRHIRQEGAVIFYDCSTKCYTVRLHCVPRSLSKAQLDTRFVGGHAVGRHDGLWDAVSRVGRGAQAATRVVGREVHRAANVIAHTTIAVGALALDEGQGKRFTDLVGKGLKRTLQTLVAPADGNNASKEMLVGSSLAKWMVDAGGEFPKLAQVLAVQVTLSMVGEYC